MAIKYVDTTEVKDIANEIIKLCNDLDSEFNKFFNKMNSVPTVSREWVGQTATYYFNTYEKDCLEYKKFVNSIRMLAKSLNANMRSVSSCVSKNRGIE